MADAPEDQPLWMPKGSVRSIAFLFLLGLTAVLLLTQTGPVAERVPEQLWLADATAFAFYFGTRK